VSATITSEAELIATYLAPLARGCEGAFGLGDDCAYLSPQPGTDLVVTTDAVAAGVHFFADDAPEDIGWKALAVNVSDLAAKAATPRVYQMALSFPEAPTHDFMARLTRGLADAQAAFGIVLCGGDTDRRPGPMTITITAFGEVPTGWRLTRAGASAGDVIFVAGQLGEAALGLKLRRGDEDARAWPLTTPERAELVGRYLRPSPQLAVQPALKMWATAAMDLSDGLAKDLGRLTALTGLGAAIVADRLPLSPAVRRLLGADGWLLDLVLSGGDDYAVLFTTAPGLESEVLLWARSHGVALAPIGQMTTRPGLVLESADGTRRVLAAAGWDHF
jgi:thiamine-monophosphate kinase